jgi:hypothetical protein
MVGDQQQRSGFLPLRGLANVLTLLLAVVVTAIAASLVIQLLSPGSAHWRHSITDLRLDKAADIRSGCTGLGW